MMNEKKITKAQKFAMLKAIPAVAENEMLVEFIDHEMELLAKKNSADKKPTAQQTANAEIAKAIVDRHHGKIKAVASSATEITFKITL